MIQEIRDAWRAPSGRVVPISLHECLLHNRGSVYVAPLDFHNVLVLRSEAGEKENGKINKV